MCRTETIGPVSFYALLRRFGSARAALDALPRLSRPVTAMSRRDAEVELVALGRLGASLVCWGEPDYPATLAAVLWHGRATDDGALKIDGDRAAAERFLALFPAPQPARG